VHCTIGVSSWKKSWIQFSVGKHGEEAFQIWVSLDWTALGFMLRLRHFILKRKLVDTIPSLPTVTDPTYQTCRMEESCATYHHFSEEVKDKFEQLEEQD
jgi:hypothetical protein